MYDGYRANGSGSAGGLPASNRAANNFRNSRSRQRTQKVGEMIAGGGGFGTSTMAASAYGASSSNYPPSASSGSSNGVGSGFLPSAVASSQPRRANGKREAGGTYGGGGGGYSNGNSTGAGASLSATMNSLGGGGGGGSNGSSLGGGGGGSDGRRSRGGGRSMASAGSRAMGLGSTGGADLYGGGNNNAGGGGGRHRSEPSGAPGLLPNIGGGQGNSGHNSADTSNSNGGNNSGYGGGGGNSGGVPAASLPSGGSRRHRSKHNHAGAHVHTGVPVTKSERSVRAACHSIEGVKPGNPNWTNQDNFLMSEDVSPSLHVWSVFDGHGQDGHHVSKYCREKFVNIWLDHDQHMPKAFKTMQAELDKQPFDVRCAGATAVVVVCRKGVLEVGNLGDSRAVLGRKHQGAVAAVMLTSDHKPDRPDERRRVLAAGGQVGSRQLVVGHNAKGPVTMPLGPARVWYTTRGETMGLAMSRSFGDAIVHTMGVSAEPEISEHTIDGSDCFLILATDGIWDVIESAQAVQLVAQHLARATASNPSAPWDVQDAATVLATTARRRWEQLSPMVDDITAIVVDLRPHVMGNNKP